MKVNILCDSSDAERQDGYFQAFLSDDTISLEFIRSEGGRSFKEEWGYGGDAEFSLESDNYHIAKDALRTKLQEKINYYKSAVELMECQIMGKA